MQLQLRQSAWVTFLLCGALFLLNFSSNPPNGKTGAPGEPTCNDCHTGTVLANDNVTINGFPSEIISGQTYNISVSINKGAATSASRAGFQLVVIDKNDPTGVSVGTFGNFGPSVGTNTVSSSNRTYLEHRSPEIMYSSPTCSNCSVVYTADWTAPTTGVNEVHVFTSANIANGSGTSGDRIVNASITNIPLPVELVKFEVIENTNHIDIIWETASENNSAYFEILRSSNGRDYEILEQIDARGFSDDLTQYHYKDEEPIQNKTSYYKLGQYDIDGKFSYSNIQAIEYLRYQKEEYRIYPNPVDAGECIFVEYLATNDMNEIEVAVFNQNGVRVYHNLSNGGLFTGMNKIIIDSKQLQQGLYYVVIQSNRESIVMEKIVVL